MPDCRKVFMELKAFYLRIIDFFAAIFSLASPKSKRYRLILIYPLHYGATNKTLSVKKEMMKNAMMVVFMLLAPFFFGACVSNPINERTGAHYYECARQSW